MFNSLASVEMSLIEELWRYFVEHYLTPKYGLYENITITQDPLISPAIIFVAVFVAIMTASAAFIFTKRVLGRMVRRLLKQGCFGHIDAKSFAELGLEKFKAGELVAYGELVPQYVRLSQAEQDKLKKED